MGIEVTTSGGTSNYQIDISSSGRSTIVIPSKYRGIPGPKGDTGLVVVNHGNDPTVERPEGAEVIMWRGSVAPQNWDTDTDLWLRVEAE